MSFVKQIRELWDHLRGKGPAAAVALTLDLGEARDNTPYFLEAGGLIVETCSGDLYAKINGPNGDGFNLRYVHRILFPVSSLYLTNSAQSGKSARLLLMPTGMEANCPDVKRLVAGTGITLDPTTGVGEVTISAAAAGAGENSWMHYRRSSYYHSAPLGGVMTTFGPGANYLRALAFYVPVETTFDRIAIYVYTAAAGVVRLGIYADNGAVYPGALILDAGTVDVGTTGLKEIVINLTLSAGLYWLATFGNSAVTLQGPAVMYEFAPIGRTAPNVVAFNSWYCALVYTILPDPFPSGGIPTSSAVVAQLRKA